MAESKTYRLIANETGVRLDKWVSQNTPELSRAYIQKLISGGYVTVNGEPVKPSFKIKTGDQISVTIPPPKTSSLSAEPIALDIVYEDDDVLVINKPAGLTVHPAPGHPEHTLVNAILAHFPYLPGESLRPGIVHRLDKDTSGLVVVAKTATAQANLSEQFKSRSVLKVYRVLVRGRLKPEHGIIEAPIGRDSHDRKRMAVVVKGREATTEYRVLEYLDGYSLLEIILKTGRTHQIRVHLAAIGYPVVGDSTYGVKSPLLPRQFVHAYRLGFKLPSSGEYREFTAELPPDLKQALAKITSAHLSLPSAPVGRLRRTTKQSHSSN